MQSKQNSRVVAKIRYNNKKNPWPENWKNLTRKDIKKNKKYSSKGTQRQSFSVAIGLIRQRKHAAAAGGTSFARFDLLFRCFCCALPCFGSNMWCLGLGILLRKKGWPRTPAIAMRWDLISGICWFVVPECFMFAVRLCVRVLVISWSGFSGELAFCWKYDFGWVFRGFPARFIVVCIFLFLIFFCFCPSWWLVF